MNIEILKTRKTAIFNLLKDAEKKIHVKVSGNSMFPFIKPGDSVCIDLSKTNKYACGDIIAYLDEDRIIVHRFIKRKKIKNQYFFCQKGDNISGWSWISKDKIMGKLLSVHKKNSKIINLNNKKHIIKSRLAGLIIFFIVSSHEFVSLFIKKRNKNRFVILLPLWQKTMLLITYILKRILNNENSIIYSINKPKHLN